jgi:hypothetical protein
MRAKCAGAYNKDGAAGANSSKVAQTDLIIAGGACVDVKLLDVASTFPGSKLRGINAVVVGVVIVRSKLMELGAWVAWALRSFK